MNSYNKIWLDWDMGDEIEAINFITQWLTKEEQNQLGKIHGHGGCITLFWKKDISRRWQEYEDKEGGIEVKREDFYDYWHVFNEILQIQKPSRYISKNDRYVVLKRQRWRCNICNEKLKYSKKSKWGGEVAHIDHIHPFSKWNTYLGFNINEISNLQALCPNCNMKKNKKKIN